MNHVLPVRVLRALEQVAPAGVPLTLAFDRHCRGARLHAAAPSPALALGDLPATAAVVSGKRVALYTQPWRLAQPGVMLKVEQELLALKARGAIQAFEFVRNRPLAHCEDVIDLIVTLP
jgi:hypothetical protein